MGREILSTMFSVFSPISFPKNTVVGLAGPCPLKCHRGLTSNPLALVTLLVALLLRRVGPCFFSSAWGSSLLHPTAQTDPIFSFLFQAKESYPFFEDPLF